MAHDLSIDEWERFRVAFKRLYEAQGDTVPTIAVKMRTSPYTVQSWLKKPGGRSAKPPSLDKVDAAAAALRVSRDDLIGPRAVHLLEYRTEDVDPLLLRRLREAAEEVNRDYVARHPPRPLPPPVKGDRSAAKKQ